MLITFKTVARYPNITMFGDVAMRLLRLMGRREVVPSAIEPDEIPEALERLRAGLMEDASSEDNEPADPGPDGEPTVSISARAVPLIELLEAASKANEAVTWDEGDGLP